MSEANTQDGIAIIGMAGRFPKARNIAEFWRNLRDGVEAVSFFDDSEIEDPTFEPGGNPNYVKARGVLEDADKFDAAFFGIQPKEAEIMDPQHRVFLECAWEALEDAGYDSEREERPIGVFAGLSMNSYLVANLITNPALMELMGSYQTMLANDKDYLPTRVSYKLNLRGPSFCVQTACSTSLVAICVACQQLASYQCDMALAGGVSITFPQRKGHLYQEGGISSPDGHCRAFDEKAQGTVDGDGVGIVVLKRLSDAIADGDEIYAVIKGFAVNNDGGMKAGYSAPSEDGQAEVIALAQALAGVDPESIQYVVTHGTGTPLGDPIEIAGLTKAFRAGTRAKEFCALTSVKTNIGHLDAAAGVAGLIEAVLALQHKQVPPSLHFERPNPKIDFANSPFFVNTRLREWKRGATPRRAGVSAFGIGGTNAHVVLEEAPQLLRSNSAGEALHLFVCSARTSTALETATQELANHLRANPAAPLADIAYTLQAGRRQFSHRRCFLASTVEEAVRILSGADRGRLSTRVAEQHKPRVAFMFPGQGAQVINMGRQLYERAPVFRRAIDECAELLMPALGEDIRWLLFPTPKDIEKATKELQKTSFTQPALFMTAYAMAKYWMNLDIQPESMIGHSIGEYVAACVAGVIELPDALKLVAARGKLMQEMAGGSMLAVRASDGDLQPLLEGELGIAAINGPFQCVVSGPAEAVDAFERRLGERKIACQRLRTSHAFHSAMMEPMLERFATELRGVTLRAPRIPFISNFTGTWIATEQATDPGYWVQHLRKTVRFAEGIGELLKEPHRILLEVGPGQTLSALARQQAGRDRVVVASLGRSTAGEEHRAVLEAAGQLWLTGVSLEWAALHEGGRRRLHLPTYPFERRRYLVEPGRRLARPIDDVAPAQTAQEPAEVSHIERNGSATMHCVRELFEKLSGLTADEMSADATFMEIGFDSLFLTQASQAIEKAFGVRVAFGHLVEKYSTLNLLAAYLDSAKPADARQPAQQDSLNVSNNGNGAMIVPLTEAQREIWFSTQRGDEATCVFNETFCVEFEGELDSDALDRAVQALVNRHEALRISIAPDGQTQMIAPEAQVQVQRLNLLDIEMSAREQRFKDLLDSEARRTFDLTQGPLARFHLVQLGDDRHALLVTSHHIVCDGGSISLMLRDLGQLYTAECKGQKAELPPPYQFGKYAAQQSVDKNGDERSTAERYWIQQFATAASDLELPYDAPRPAVQSLRAGQARRQLRSGLARELKRLGATQGATLFTTLLSAYYILLHRLSGQEDLVVGVPASGRGTGLNEKMVGHCVNFLPMRLQVKHAASVSEHIAVVRRKFVEAYDHQSYTFGSLIQQLALPRTANRMPLVSATFNLEKFRGGVSFHGVEARIRGNHRLFTNFDLTFDVLERDGELSIDCTYSAELFHGETVTRWLQHFETLLEGMISDPAITLSQAPLLTEQERKHIVVDWNNTAMEFPHAACMHELFEAQAQRTPDAVAAIVGRQTITYRELNRRANQLAHHLKTLGVGPNVLVGLCVERSFALLVGAFGILKAGGAYVPLDWTYPPERVRFMIDDTQAPVLVTQASLLQHVPQTNARIVCLDSDWEQIAARETVNPEKAGVSTDLAYLMYTSGSTGLAKGVGLEHRSAVSFIHWAREAFSAEELKGVLASTSICFDLSIFEVFVPLSWGGTVVLADNAVDLPTPVAEHEITLINTVPSAIKDLLKAGTIPRSVSVVNLAGEKLTTAVVQQLYELGHIKKVYDLYGPSEATTYATWVLRKADEPATVGRPLANTQVYILDRHMQPCPIGVPGEIYIGGDCLARGYINRPELTAEKFVPNPFNNAGERLYKTGDLGRFLADGKIDFIGRSDYQIKIRGYRIELGEIETVLGQHPRVQECVAVVREEGPDQKQLAAYVVISAGTNLTATEVRRFLRERLPDYMVPTFFVTLPALPLMPNGKVNRAALPPPSASITLADEQEQEAITPVQQALIDIWREVIGVENVGLHDDFFDLGGHSVLVTQITSRIRQVFEVELSMRHLFGAPTVAALAEVIEPLLEEQVQSLSEEQIQQLTAPAKEAS